MNIRPIKTPEDHKAALARIDKLMNAEADTPEVAEIEMLAILVERPVSARMRERRTSGVASARLVAMECIFNVLSMPYAA